MLLVIYQDKKKKYEPPIPTRVGKKQKKTKGPDAANKLPQGTLSKDIYITTSYKFLKGAACACFGQPCTSKHISEVNG